MIPGEIFPADGTLTLNEGKTAITLRVKNAGDRPVQVGSHYHFFEVNEGLKFDRDKARGMRLDIAAGTAVRFEPGDTRAVDLVAIGGTRDVSGLNDLVNGPLDDPAVIAVLESNSMQSLYMDSATYSRFASEKFTSARALIQRLGLASRPG